MPTTILLAISLSNFIWLVVALFIMFTSLSIVVLAAMLAVWYYFDQVAAPDLEQRLTQGARAAFEDPAELRGRLDAYRSFAERLLWLSGAVLICGCSIATLPTAEAKEKKGSG